MGDIFRDGGITRNLDKVGEPHDHAVGIMGMGVGILSVLRKIKNSTPHLVPDTISEEPAHLVPVPPGEGVHHVAMARHQGQPSQHQDKHN